MRHSDVVHCERFRWIWDLTCVFWAENAKNNLGLARDGAFFPSYWPMARPKFYLGRRHVDVASELQSCHFPCSVVWKLRLQKAASLGRQIGSLAQESIGDDEFVVRVARMRSGTIDHSAKKPTAIQRGNGSQLVVPGAPNVGEVLGQ